MASPLRGAAAAALRHAWLRRLAARLLAPFPGLRASLVRRAFAPLPLASVGHRGAPSVAAADDPALGLLGPDARLIHQRLCAAIGAHGG
jgi:hypothetical protein